MAYYPSSLPGPTKSVHTPKARVSSPNLPGVGGYSARERDYSGTQDVEFFLTREQAAVWYAWWKDTLNDGGYWFNANWPALRPGFMVLQFITEPIFTHVYDGAHRVSATVQVRGASLEIQPVDPDWADVILLLNGATTLTTDASPLNNALTAEGAASLDTGTQLFGVPTYLIPDVGTNRLKLTASDAWIATAQADNEWCLEMHAAPLGAGPGETRFCYFGPILSFAWDDTGSFFTAGCVIAGTSYTLSSAPGSAIAGDMHHLRLVRDHSTGVLGVLKFYLDGVLVDTSAGFTKTNTMQTGGSFGWLIGYNSIGAYGNFSNLRLTKNTARSYSDFTPPDAQYPIRG